MGEFAQMMVHSAIAVCARLVPYHHGVLVQQMLVIRIHVKMGAHALQQALAVIVACVRHAKPDEIVNWDHDLVVAF